MCSGLEIEFTSGMRIVEALRGCDGPSGCGVPESMVYHLAASGLVRSIRARDERTGRQLLSLYGPELATFVDAYNEKREQRVKTNVHVTIEMVKGKPAKVESRSKVREALEAE